MGRVGEFFDPTFQVYETFRLGYAWTTPFLVLVPFVAQYFIVFCHPYIWNRVPSITSALWTTFSFLLWNPTDVSEPRNFLPNKKPATWVHHLQKQSLSLVEMGV